MSEPVDYLPGDAQALIDRIGRVGWRKGAAENPDHQPCCLLDHVGQLNLPHARHRALERALQDVVVLRYPRDKYPGVYAYMWDTKDYAPILVRWNDQICTRGRQAQALVRGVLRGSR